MRESIEMIKPQVDALIEKALALKVPNARKIAILNNVSDINRLLDDALNQVRLAEQDEADAKAAEKPLDAPGVI